MRKDDLPRWLKEFCAKLQEKFGNRLVFFGLQGSHARGEQREGSDLDVVAVFDELQFSDLAVYRSVCDGMPARDAICGFVAGKAELMAWDTAELFQFYFDTVPIDGILDFLKPLIDKTAISRAVRTGAGAVYHACVHNFIHERDEMLLRGAYKAAVFVLQALHYQRTGVYVARKNDLRSLLPADERALLDRAAHIRDAGIGEEEFTEYSRILFLWVQKILI